MLRLPWHRIAQTQVQNMAVSIADARVLVDNVLTDNHGLQDLQQAAAAAD